jgi:DNA-binding NarL/FixJ family response regulator
MVRPNNLNHISCMQHRSVPLRVFLAEDSPLIRERVAAMLGGDGMAIVGEAHTPQSCIDGILGAHPDVVVLDVQLDGGSGMEVMHAVHDAAPDIPFVVFTINSEPAFRKHYLDEGASSFLDKATEFDQLVPAVTGACRTAH